MSVIWLRFSELSIEYFNEVVFYKIGIFFRKPIKIDYNTTTSSRAKNAKVCIVTDLAKHLIPDFTLQGEIFIMEYEYIHQFCFKCGRVGHNGCQSVILKAIFFLLVWICYKLDFAILMRIFMGNGCIILFILILCMYVFYSIQQMIWCVEFSLNTDDHIIGSCGI